MSNTVVGPGHVIAQRYRIERWLGQGGMGSVYRAVQLSMGRTVALKRLVDEHLQVASHVERFEREALALSRLSHQSTVRLFDFGTDERGCPFIVMEFLDGVDLATDIDRHGPMRWDHALAVSLQVLGSLDEAHAAGIVHRDIKPANLFLCTGPEWPVVKVLDFGIAGNAQPDADARKLTLTGTVLGSAPYMSPEQARGLPVTAAADLYSFGVVLFEMLTGKTPFEGRPLTAQLLAKVLEPAPELRSACPDLAAPAPVHALVAALLDRDPSRRPASARATADIITRLLAGVSLPPLSRAAQRPMSTAAGVVRTEPMLVPRTIDEGWIPPQLVAERRPVRSRVALGSGLLLAASVTAMTAWVSTSSLAPALRASVAALVPWTTSDDIGGASIVPTASSTVGGRGIEIDGSSGAGIVAARAETTSLTALARQPRELESIEALSPETSAATEELSLDEPKESAPEARDEAASKAPRERSKERASRQRRVTPRPQAVIATTTEPEPAAVTPGPEAPGGSTPTPASAATPPASAPGFGPSSGPAASSEPAVSSGPAASSEPAVSLEPAVSSEPGGPRAVPGAPAPRASAPTDPSASGPFPAPDGPVPVTPDRLLPGATIPVEPPGPARERAEPGVEHRPAAPVTTPEAPPEPDGSLDSVAAQRQAPRRAVPDPARQAPITDPRYWTISSARAAARGGELTPAQRNEIVAALQRRRLDARARAARAYRQGRIGYEELLERQRAIDRRIEGW